MGLILKADISFMAFPVEEETHTLHIKYSTPGFGVGSAVSLLDLLGCFFTFIVTIS